MELFTKITNGDFQSSVVRAIKDYLSRLEGKEVVINIERKKNKRTTSQNAYYWGVVVDILSQHTGYEKEEIHEILKYKFLGFEKKTIGKERIPVTNSSIKLSTIDFMAYIDKIQRWAAMELDVYIPSPEEQGLKLNDKTCFILANAGNIASPKFFIKQIRLAANEKTVNKILNNKAVQLLGGDDKARVDKAGMEKVKELKEKKE